MPKSKRVRSVSAKLNASVQPKTRSSKEKLLSSIQESVTSFQHLFLFRVNNMRNQSMKEVRDLWQGSRFFMGKTSVMRRALETCGDEQQHKSLQHLCHHISGEVGLFFTDSDVKKVLDWFGSYRVPNYAKAGFISDREFKLSDGPLPQDIAPFSIEPQLRKLGLPTRLRNGVVELTIPVTVCQVGDRLTPEQCRILQLFDEKLAHFQLKVVGVWSAAQGFKPFAQQQTSAVPASHRMADDNDKDENDANEMMAVDEDDENEMNVHTDAKIAEVFANAASASSAAAPSASASASVPEPVSPPASSSSSSSAAAAAFTSTRLLRSHTKAATATATATGAVSSSRRSTSSSLSATPYGAAVAARNSARKSKTKSKKGKAAQADDEDDAMDE